MLRARRNCSSDSQFDMEVTDITHRLAERQYPHLMLNRATHIAKKRDRSSLLFNHTLTTPSETLRREQLRPPPPFLYGV